MRPWSSLRRYWDLVLLLLELVDHRLQIVVGEGGEIGQRFHGGAFRSRGSLLK